MKKFLATLAALATLTAASTPALAIPMAGNTYEHHQLLWNTLREVGIATVLNGPDCAEGSDGTYRPSNKTLTVCQDNGEVGGPAVAWTDNDFDTLRHEAHHVVQDCLGVRSGNGLFRLYFTEEEDYLTFVGNALTERQIKGITENYASRGVEGVMLLAELEAFAAANSVSAEVIANSVSTFCLAQ